MKNQNESLRVAMEFGFLQCEKGNNLTMAFINFDKLLIEPAESHTAEVTKAQHTRGEWKTKGINIVNEQGERIALCCGALDKPLTDDEANAQRIVKAVNEREDLLSTLRSLKSQVETLQLEGGIKKGISNERVNMLSAYLLQANKLLKQAEQK